MEHQKSQNPGFIFSDDGGRPTIEKYSSTSRFRPGDQVYLRPAGTGSREGPYQVASVPQAGKYTLCDKDKRPVNSGNVVEEKVLELYDPFAAS